MAVLTINQVSVTLSGAPLLQSVSMAAKAGEIHAIVGPNGAGKTTLLNTITGDSPLTTGHIELQGQNLWRWPRQQLAKSLAVLPQLSLLNFPYTVEEVVGLGRIPHSSGWRQDHDITQQAMAALDITHLATRLYTQLSGGEKQRTQLARVMTQIWRKEDASARVLLLDEPTSALDLGHQQQLMDAICRFAADGVAVVMVVHDVNLAASYASHTLALRDGKVLAQGATAQVFTEPMLRALFDAEVNLVRHPETNTPYVIA